MIVSLSTIVEGESVSFVCEANNDLDAIEDIRIHWLNNNGHRIRHHDHRITISTTMETDLNRTVMSTLTIDPVIRQDDGRYRCEALNHHDLTVTRTTWLTVQCKLLASCSQYTLQVCSKKLLLVVLLTKCGPFQQNTSSEL